MNTKDIPPFIEKITKDCDGNIDLEKQYEFSWEMNLELHEDLVKVFKYFIRGHVEGSFFSEGGIDHLDIIYQQIKDVEGDSKAHVSTKLHMTGEQVMVIVFGLLPLLGLTDDNEGLRKVLRNPKDFDQWVESFFNKVKEVEIN